jgi:hypothetical protein
MNQTMDARSLPPDFQILQSNDTFQYAPLPDPRTHIRLLRRTDRSLWSVQKKEVYTDYDFDVYHIDHLPEYATLSYEWGAEGPSQPVYIQAKLKEVTQNLFDFLSQCWRFYSWLGGERRYIWIDALCINQEDKEEKSSQIPLMSKIYSGSIRTMAWLGDAAGDDLHSLYALLSLPVEEFSSMPLPRFNWTTLVIDHDYESAYQLISNSYWTRLWVMQEIILSPKIEVCAGSALPMYWKRFSIGILRYGYILERIMFQGIRDQRNVRALGEKWLSVHHNGAERLNPGADIPSPGQNGHWAFFFFFFFLIHLHCTIYY